MSFRAFIIIFICCLTQIIGCATTSQKSNKIFNTHNFKNAAIDALTQPSTWIPAAGALTVAATNTDKKISDWAIENSPVFGSQEKAEHASDVLREASEMGFYGTMLPVSVSAGLGAAVSSKLIESSVSIGALNLVNETTTYLKNTVRRQRPNGGARASFPSRHTSSAFAHSILAKRNIANTGLHHVGKTGFNVAFTALSVGTAWGRVEGEAHYPSDVMAGAALASFVSHFFYNAFIDNPNQQIGVTVNSAEKSGSIGVKVQF